MTSHSRGLPCGTLLAWIVIISGSSSPAVGQTARTVRDSIIQVLGRSDVSLGWLSEHSARLVVQEYGREAGRVAEQLLERPQVSTSSWNQLFGALAVGAYESSGFPIARLQDLASGRTPVHAKASINRAFRAAALAALSARPRPELADYWRALMGDKDWTVRQHAVAGLACSIGGAALPELTRLSEVQGDSVVNRVARFYVAEIADSGEAARTCLRGTLKREDAASLMLAPDTNLVSKAKVLFGFEQSDERRQRLRFSRSSP